MRMGTGEEQAMRRLIPLLACIIAAGPVSAGTTSAQAGQPPSALQHPVQAKPALDSPAAPTPNPQQSAQVIWQRKVIERLCSLHYIPPGIALSGSSATADVLIEIDRKGHIIYFRIVRSSGYSALDHAVRSLMRHADPLPAPPPPQNDLPDAPLSFVISIGYDKEPN